MPRSGQSRSTPAEQVLVCIGHFPRGPKTWTEQKQLSGLCHIPSLEIQTEIPLNSETIVKHSMIQS